MCTSQGRRLLSTGRGSGETDSRREGVETLARRPRTQDNEYTREAEGDGGEKARALSLSGSGMARWRWCEGAGQACRRRDGWRSGCGLRTQKLALP
jgi:hypothetical protein